MKRQTTQSLSLTKLGSISKMTSTEFKKHLAAAGMPPSIHGNKKQAAQTLGISERTLNRYLKSGCQNLTVINHLLTLVYGISQTSSWSGWRINAQYLISPDGDHIRQSDIRTLWADRKVKQHLEARLAHVEKQLHFYHSKDKQNKVVKLEQFKQVAELANEIENIVGHFEQLSRFYID